MSVSVLDCPPTADNAKRDGAIARARNEVGDLAHPFSIELVGDGVRTHFRLEHRPVDLKSVVIDILDWGQAPPEPVEAPVPAQTVPATVTRGAFSLDFEAEFDIIHVEIEETGADPTPVLPQTRRYRASNYFRSDFDDGEKFFQIAVGVYIDVDAGQVVFDEAPWVGSIYRVEGRKFRYFTDADYHRFLDTAAAQIGHNRVNDSGNAWSISDLAPVEEYPLAILTSIQALWALATDASFDIDILAPDGVNIPRSERFRQLMEMIGARQTQYDEMAQALNIGISRLETYTVRRVAKMTNRLVPVYLSREFDDWSKPKRVILEQNLYGTTPVQTMVGSMNIDIYSGYPWQMVIDLGCDLTTDAPVLETEWTRVGAFDDNFGSGFDTTWEARITETGRQRILHWHPQAEIRKNRGAPYGPALRKMGCQVLDAQKGTVLLWLDVDDTRYLPYNAFWELQLRPDDNRTPLPVLSGMIRASITEVVL